MSTASGLMVSVAGTISFDLWRGGAAAVDARRRRFRLAALGGVVAPVALALVARGLDISVLVGWAFALAASTFCPLLLLGIWWERLTARGAAAGLVAGAVVATGAIFTGLWQDGGHPTVEALLTQPAVISVPVAFGVMIAVSLADRAGRRTADAQLLALHAPEGLGLGFETDQEEVVGRPARA
jgi:Na+(H+)/acetate symporter ActP